MDYPRYFGRLLALWALSSESTRLVAEAMLNEGASDAPTVVRLGVPDTDASSYSCEYEDDSRYELDCYRM